MVERVAGIERRGVWLASLWPPNKEAPADLSTDLSQTSDASQALARLRAALEADDDAIETPLARLMRLRAEQ